MSGHKKYIPMELPIITSSNHLDPLPDHDGVILVFHDASSLSSLGGPLAECFSDLHKYIALDQTASKVGTANFLLTPSGERVVFSCTGPLLRDFDDVRRYATAAEKAVERAKGSGSIKDPLFFLQPPPYSQMEKEIEEQFKNYIEVGILAALAELHDPIEAREAFAAYGKPALTGSNILSLHVINAGNDPVDLKTAKAIELGRRLARDVGGPDPERMTSIIAAETIQEYMEQFPNVKVEIVSDAEDLKREYPLLAAVARASEHVERHAPRVVYLEYRSSDQSKVTEELYMVGKGINYDTGGADIKVGGSMAGMSRDKCGASALAGFLASIATLSPLHLNVSISLAFVRNSAGSNAYVADEIIRSRAGLRVRVGNTDAEGRMVMTDLLAHQKERALNSQDPSRARIFTCATLTGHVGRALGPYFAVLENGPARIIRIGSRIRSRGQLIGDCNEISNLRREDFDFVNPITSCEDVIQAGKVSSVLTNRGHQYPAAFMTIASGLADHGLDAEKAKRLAFTHLDIAGVADAGYLQKVTGSPVPALVWSFCKID